MVIPWVLLCVLTGGNTFTGTSQRTFHGLICLLRLFDCAFVFSFTWLSTFQRNNIKSENGEAKAFSSVSEYEAGTQCRLKDAAITCNSCITKLECLPRENLPGLCSSIWDWTLRTHWLAKHSEHEWQPEGAREKRERKEAWGETGMWGKEHGKEVLLSLNSI